MTDWFRKRKETVEPEDVENYVQMYCNQYKTNTVISNVPRVLRGEWYCIEVWVNLNSAQHLVNVYTAIGPEETAEEAV